MVLKARQVIKNIPKVASDLAAKIHVGYWGKKSTVSLPSFIRFTWNCNEKCLGIGRVFVAWK